MSSRHFLIGITVVALAILAAVHGLHKSKVFLECSQRGALDSPASAAITGPSVVVEGWAHDADGIVEVQVLSGDRSVASQKPQLLRDDVVKALRNCGDVGRPGFHIEVPVGTLSRASQVLLVQAVKQSGEVYPLGKISLEFEGVVGRLDTPDPIRWNGRNILMGWALAQEGTVSVHVMARDQEVARTAAELPRDDVGRAFPAWSTAARAGFAMPLSMSSLPRGRYPLKLLLRASNGRELVLAGPEVQNDMPIGEVLSAENRWIDPERVPLNVWVFDEDGIEAAYAETEAGLRLGGIAVRNGRISLHEFEQPGEDGTGITGNPGLVGTAFTFDVDGKELPEGLQRLVVRAIDKTGRETILPGPLVLKGAKHAPPCPGEQTRMYFPGFRGVFRTGFPQMRSFRRMLDGGCVEVGIRGRVEYLRTTRGRRHDYVFDPDFPATVPGSKGKSSGESLHELFAIAVRLKAPLLITLDGGVWADARFPAPEFDAVDMLEEDARTAQWNQHGRAEPDDALSGLAGSMDNPQLARMMTLNRFNHRFRAYKKRNLQAAAREIVRFSRQHPTLHVAVNLDPDQYINPWFYLTQWYDYNPDTLREFREWLFHLGPYADGDAMANMRYRGVITLDQVSQLAGANFSSIDDVQPPRGKIDYADGWQQVWTQFKRHLVARHYDELANWVTEAGLPTDRAYTSQTFIQTDVAIETDDQATGWTDQAGVSIAGAKPREGHLGVILYGPSSRNEGKPRSGLSLIDNIRRTDSRWGLVEFHPATIEFPATSPSHDEAYRTMLATVNGGARFFSPMWGSVARDQMLKPERFRSYDALDGTTFEYQMAWWMMSLRTLPAGSMFFPFGNDLVESDDGWRGSSETRMTLNKGKLLLSGDRIEINSPKWDWGGLAQTVSVMVAGSWPGRRPDIALELGDGRRLPCTTEPGDQRRAQCNISSIEKRSAVGLSISWLSAGGTARPIEVTDVALRFLP